jgi:2'-5' RNA ligase
MPLFYALSPDAVTRDHLTSAAARLSLSGAARPVVPSNLHITLAFVEVSVPDMRTFSEMGAMLGLRRCAIVLDMFDYWPKSQAPVLAARNNPGELAAQTDQLRAAIAKKVYHRRDAKPWRAHVTLARKVTQPPVLTAMSPVAWVSHSFCLMSSRTDGDDSVYTVVDSWPLLDKP